MKKIITLVFIAVASLSCTKEIELKEGTLGAEATNEDVQKAINSALANVSIVNARVGQYSSYNYNYRLEMQGVVWYERIDHKLNDIIDTDTQIDFNIAQDKFTYDLTSGEIIDEKHSEFSVGFDKSPAPTRSLAMFSQKLKTMSGACDGVDETDSQGYTYDCIKYFNLELSRVSVPAPALVAAKPNCMNLPGCKIVVNRLKFDEVKWRQKKSVVTIKIEADIADNVADLMYVPVEGGFSYTPASVSFCDTGPYVQDGVKYKLRKCSVLRDFQ